MFCSKCGKEIPDGTAFCSFCGTPLNGNSPAQDVKGVAGSFLKSMQEKAKTVGDSLNKAAEEARASAAEAKQNQEAIKESRGVSNDRFEHHYMTFAAGGSSSLSNHVSGEIIIDRKTGVNYLLVMSVDHSGLTVLVDKDGKPLVTPLDELN